MAVTKQSTFRYRAKRSIHRKGIHSKNNTSHIKSSKIYKKKYRGQGR